jgi:hypothetical protein
MQRLIPATKSDKSQNADESTEPLASDHDDKKCLRKTREDRKNEQIMKMIARQEKKIAKRRGRKKGKKLTLATLGSKVLGPIITVSFSESVLEERDRL